MSDIAIKVENISKRYRIGVKEQVHDTLGGAFISWVKYPLSNFKRVQKLSKFAGNDAEDIIWAVRDISFEVKAGEVLGIIGKNGAGKSTLLKILARITEPTSGSVVIDGRIASLLEVGTGFHPELTGRENVYLNGTILGMRKKEIERKFDEILEFSGVEKFIDTPVKRYSSGMRVRLAFAVAAHLEPEILLIDEVLAVGDTEFQKRCIGKMGEIAGEGRTVLFVSHNMAAVQSLCSRGVLLEDGKVVIDSTIREVVSQYVTKAKSVIENTSIANRTDRKYGTQFRFTSLDFFNEKIGEATQTFLTGQKVIIKINYKNISERTFEQVSVTISFFHSLGHFLFGCRSDVLGTLYRVGPGSGSVYCIIPRLPLNSGLYTFNLFAESQGVDLDSIKEVGHINVEAGDYYGTGKLPAAKRQGVFIDYYWIEDNASI